MKKLLFLVLASFLVLAACGNEEESKLDDKKETKASDKESKKDDKKKDDDKKLDKEKDKSDDKSNEEVVTEDETTEQPVQSQEQVNAQEQQPVQSQEQEIQGGNDAGATEEMEEFYQQERAKEQENSNSLSEQEIENEINQKANTPEGAEVIRSLGEQGIRTNPPGEAIGN